MTNNEKLARWQGKLSQFTSLIKTPTGYWPDYLNDDAAAMSLLDTLVEKGFYPLFEYKLFDGAEQWNLQLWIKEKHGSSWETFFVCEAGAKSRRAAVCAAVLELIGKEDV